MTGPLSARLPDFPWDTIADAKGRATAHPDGLCDLSVGTPVDPVPALALATLAASGPRWASYPTVWGTPELRAAIREYLARRWGSVPLTDRNVLPVIGTKELVAALPTLLGLGPGDVVVIPETAYPTYEVGARVVGAEPVACDDPARLAELRDLLGLTGQRAASQSTRAWTEAERGLAADRPPHWG